MRAKIAIATEVFMVEFRDDHESKCAALYTQDILHFCDYHGIFKFLVKKLNMNVNYSEKRNDIYRLSELHSFA